MLVSSWTSFFNHLNYNYLPFPRYILYQMSSISASLGPAGLDSWESWIVMLKGFPETATDIQVKMYSNNTEGTFREDRNYVI